MKKGIVISFLSLLSIASLAGCNQTSGGVKVNSAKSGVQYLVTSKNYTFSYVHDSYAHDLVFTSKYIGIVSSASASSTDVYVQDKEGVYRLRYSNKYQPGEILNKGRSLWKDNYKNTLYGVKTSFLSGAKSSDTSITISDKEFKLAYAFMLGYTVEQFVNIDSLVVTYREEESKPILRFTLSYSGNAIIYDAHDFGTSKSELVDNFLARGGTYFTPGRGLTKARKLMLANNYAQAVYYIGESQSGYVATEYYHP